MHSTLNPKSSSSLAGLITFPVEIYTLTKITSLRLDDNHITALPPSIERLTDLTELTITNLHLAVLPFVLGALTCLTTLRLSPTRSMTNPPYEIVMQGTDVVLRYMRKLYLCVRQTSYINITQVSLRSLENQSRNMPNTRPC
jgi:Leucine-rich repeat (LRR) protein